MKLIPANQVIGSRPANITSIYADRHPSDGTTANKTSGVTVQLTLEQYLSLINRDAAQKVQATFAEKPFLDVLLPEELTPGIPLKKSQVRLAQFDEKRFSELAVWLKDEFAPALNSLGQADLGDFTALKRASNNLPVDKEAFITLVNQLEKDVGKLDLQTRKKVYIFVQLINALNTQWFNKQDLHLSCELSDVKDYKKFLKHLTCYQVMGRWAYPSKNGGINAFVGMPAYKSSPSVTVGQCELFNTSVAGVLVNYEALEHLAKSPFSSEPLKERTGERGFAEFCAAQQQVNDVIKGRYFSPQTYMPVVFGSVLHEELRHAIERIGISNVDKVPYLIVNDKFIETYMRTYYKDDSVLRKVYESAASPELKAHVGYGIYELSAQLSGLVSSPDSAFMLDEWLGEIRNNRAPYGYTSTFGGWLLGSKTGNVSVELDDKNWSRPPFDFYDLIPKLAKHPVNNLRLSAKKLNPGTFTYAIENPFIWTTGNNGELALRK